MEEKIVKIVAGKLKRYEGQPMNQEKLEAIREAVYSATGTNKFASFANVKKWIKAARSLMKKQEKEAAKKSKPMLKPAHKKAEGKKEARQPSKAEAMPEPPIPEVPKKVEESVNMIKSEASAQVQEVELAKPTIIFDKVYLQSIKFEIAGIRQTMERVSRQLDKLERELSEQAKSEE